MFSFHPGLFERWDPTAELDLDVVTDRVIDGKPYKGRPSQGYGTRRFGYTGKMMDPLPWESNAKINYMRQKIEEIIGRELHFCLAAMSGDNTVSVFPHKDTVYPDADGEYFICSVSFGSPRIFRQKWDHGGGEDFWILNPGDLVIMSRGSQELGVHDVPPMRSEAGPRLNLTFRTVGEIL